jgi:hypothetical protein
MIDKKAKGSDAPPVSPPMPFDDALRKLLKAPPQHKTTKPKKR